MVNEKEKPTVLRSLIAGSTAGAIELSITYPAEFAKTRSQLNRRLAGKGEKLPWPKFGKEWYAGCTTAVIGNSVKRALADDNGQVSGPKTVLAGFGAGVTESLLAVTPFESIKTQIIDDRKSKNPRMRGFIHGSALIAREKGITGFLQGFLPTTARQAANSAVRFGSYTTLKQLAQSYVSPGEKLGGLATFGIGATAGLITVYCTQPLDSVKTRMQSIDAKTLYKNTFHCVGKMLKEEGVRVFWAGATPRLARLMVSGGLVFTFYEKTMELFDRLDPQKRYI